MIWLLTLYVTIGLLIALGVCLGIRGDKPRLAMLLIIALTWPVFVGLIIADN